MTTSKSWMRASAILLAGSVLCACAPGSDSGAAGAGMQMAINHRPADVDVSGVSVYRPAADRSVDDNAATLLRSIDCRGSCYVAIVPGDETMGLDVLAALCGQLARDRHRVSSRVHIAIFLSGATLARGEAIAQDCSVRTPHSGFEFAAVLRTDAQ